jgi:hypothetical protein
MDREEAWTGELEVFTEMLLRAHRTEMEDNPLDLFPLTRPASTYFAAREEASWKLFVVRARGKKKGKRKSSRGKEDSVERNGALN